MGLTLLCREEEECEPWWDIHAALAFWSSCSSCVVCWARGQFSGLVKVLLSGSTLLTKLALS